MNSTTKNIISVILGLALGSAVNMGIIMISGSIIPPPDGADVTTMAGLKESIEFIDPVDAARLYVALGMHDEAISWLEKSYRERSIMMVSLKYYWI